MTYPVIYVYMNKLLKLLCEKNLASTTVYRWLRPIILNSFKARNNKLCYIHTHIPFKCFVHNQFLAYEQKKNVSKHKGRNWWTPPTLTELVLALVLAPDSKKSKYASSSEMKANKIIYSILSADTMPQMKSCLCDCWYQWIILQKGAYQTKGNLAAWTLNWHTGNSTLLKTYFNQQAEN